ncbi:MAG: rhodanese-like domain-containing protein [archaeon]
MSRIEFISLEHLLEMFANKEKFKLVEVLSREDYKRGHIPGAINLPLDKLKTVAKVHLKKNDRIVVYCGSYACQASTEAARTLLEMGYLRTLDFKAGKKGWVDADLELEQSS